MTPPPSPCGRGRGRGGRTDRPTPISIGRAALLLLPLLAACAATPVLPPCPPDPPGPVAWITDYGWHTEIAIPAAQATGNLAALRAPAPWARTLSFGFGKRSFFILDDPGLLDLLEGAVPGPAALRMTALQTAAHAGQTIELALTPAQADALSDRIWRTVAAPGLPFRTDPAHAYTFYDASRDYSLAYTCNAWTADTLAQSGLPIDAQPLRATATMRAVARLPGACTPRF